MALKRFTAALLLLLLCGSVSAMQSVNPTGSVQPPPPPRHVKQLTHAITALRSSIESIDQLVKMAEENGILDQAVHDRFQYLKEWIPETSSPQPTTDREKKLQALAQLSHLVDYIYDRHFLEYLVVCLEYIRDNYDQVTHTSVLALHRDLVVSLRKIELSELARYVLRDLEKDTSTVTNQAYIAMVIINNTIQKFNQLLQSDTTKKNEYLEYFVTKVLGQTVMHLQGPKYQWLRYIIYTIQLFFKIEKRFEVFLTEQFKPKIPDNQYQNIGFKDESSGEHESRAEKFLIQRRKLSENDGSWRMSITEYQRGSMNDLEKQKLVDDNYDQQTQECRLQQGVLNLMQQNPALEYVERIFTNLDNSYLSNQRTANSNGPSSSTDINVGNQSSDLGTITWTLDDSYFEESPNNEKEPEEEEAQEDQSEQNFEDVVHEPRKPDADAIIDALCTSKNKRALKFLAAAMSQKYIVTISHFAAFLKSINGVKIKDTSDGYKTIPLNDKTVLTTYWVPNLSDDACLDTYTGFVHQPHSGGEEFPKKTLEFVKRYLRLKGYEPIWEATKSRLA